MDSTIGWGADTKTSYAATVQQQPPLVVDVDGTLLRTDMLVEGALQLVIHHPRRAPGLLRSMLGGKAVLKAYVATESGLAVEMLPRRKRVVDMIVAAHADGRQVVLASGAHESQVVVIAGQVGADVALGSTATVNLTGHTKLRVLQDRLGAFDYVGDAPVDRPLWAAARHATIVGDSSLTRLLARRARPDVSVLPDNGPSVWRTWLRELRPHQWAKNALLLLPAVAAHVNWTLALGLRCLAGLGAFCALASAVYVINDLADLPHDRAHPTKCRRPLAAGDLSIPAALAGVTVLIAISIALAQSLPRSFCVILAGYLCLTTAYSFTLKRRAMVDVITLASLYTSRVVAGAALVAVPLSRWFLALSIFLFFSLALVKRVMELLKKPGGTELVAGRGYAPADLPVLVALGGSATAATSLVYCLYITGTEVTTLYSRPDLLWAGLPLLLYWQARLWLLTMRKKVHEDPVVFALRDRTSHMIFLAFLISVFLAT
jgi:4-hydroxybenzoate polyprenyltransferase